MCYQWILLNYIEDFSTSNVTLLADSVPHVTMFYHALQHKNEVEDTGCETLIVSSSQSKYNVRLPPLQTYIQQQM